MNNLFRKFSQRTSQAAGSPWAFLLAAATIAIWLVTGPIFKFGDTWQLVINTGTTIVTFLMVFLIQNTQNRDSKAVHLKLDEIIRATADARDSLIDLENFSEEEMQEIQNAFHDLHGSGNENVRNFASGLKEHLSGQDGEDEKDEKDEGAE